MLDRYKIDVSIRFEGLVGLPVTNPLSRSKDVPIREYLDNKEMVIGGNNISYREYIWRLSSQDSVHADDSLDEDLAMGETILIMDTPINQMQVLAIAKNVCDACFSIIEVSKLKSEGLWRPNMTLGPKESA
jgi:hypothetical protein